jgi:hypothetical protein
MEAKGEIANVKLTGSIDGLDQVSVAFLWDPAKARYHVASD